MPAQLSLWDMVNVDVPRTLAMGEIIELNESWADGDTSRDGLERLARVLVGGLEILYSDDAAEKAWLRIISARVEGDKVIATCRRIPPVLQTVADFNCEDDMEEAS